MFTKRVASAALAVALLVLLPPVASAVTTTVTFDDLSNPDRVLNGQYPSGVIDWGSNNAWWLSGAYSVDSTQSVSFNGSTLTSASFTFITPQRLLQIDAINGGSGSSTISLACAGQTTVNQAVGVNQRVTIVTNWSGTCSSVTVSSTNGWWTNFDNLVFDNGNGPVITNVQTANITTNAATIQWTTNVGATTQVDYGTTSNYGSQSALNSTLVTSHSVQLTNLSAGTQYHYRARSSDSGNNLSLSGDFTFTTSPPGCSPPITNPIPCENSLAGSPPSVWDIPTGDSGDSTIQGFATDISYPAGATVNFKISTPANAYTITIFRIGYYQGNGARQVATVNPSAPLPQSQPACLTDSTTGLIDCGNWGVSASWTIPSNAVSGVYIARLQRNDTGGVSHIHFVVRDDLGSSPILFQTSDTTWAAYNSYGGNSLYVGGPGSNPSRAYKVSYNRPFNNRSNPNGGAKSGFFWDSEYPMVRWLEANSYNVSYAAAVDTDRNGSTALQKHKVFMSNGHDEYWSGNQRANIESARGAGLNLAFFSGNTTFWKTRWENSIDSSHATYRTLVCYKETHANKVIDPADPPTWTGTWRDPRFSPPADGGRPENRLLGSIFLVNGARIDTVVVTSAYSRLRFWRNTAIATLASGGSVSLSPGSLGAEWDGDVDNGVRPPGVFDLSSTTYSVSTLLLDYGSTYGAGNATHNLTMYRDPSGALVFASGFYRWAWGLDTNHDDGGSTLDTNMQQATVNLFADMGIQPATLQSGLRLASASTDTIPPASTITSLVNGSIVSPNTTITISGTASDSGGVVAGVEVSVDGGTTWHPASGLTSWTYQWTIGASGSATIRSRAVDDSGNLESPSAGVTVTIGTAPTPTPTSSPTPTLTPTPGATPTPTPTTVAGTLLVGDSSIESMDDSNSPGMAQEFPSSARNSGTATTAHVYLTALNGGTSLVVGIYNSSHALLAKCTITALSANAWNACTLGNSVPITSGTTYNLALLQPAGQVGAINFRDRSGVGSASDTSPSSTLSDLPSTWSVGSSWPSGPASMYVN